MKDFDGVCWWGIKLDSFEVDYEKGMPSITALAAGVVFPHSKEAEEYCSIIERLAKIRGLT